MTFTHSSNRANKIFEGEVHKRDTLYIFRLYEIHRDINAACLLCNFIDMLIYLFFLQSIDQERFRLAAISNNFFGKVLH